MIQTIDTSKQDVLPTHQGWRNYPTWCVALWFANDEPLYRSALDATREAIADATTTDDDLGTESIDTDAATDAVATWLEAQVDELSEGRASGMLGDMLTWALAYVSWHEIAGSWIDDELPA